MNQDPQDEFKSYDETGSIQIDTPSLVETPSIQSTTLEKSTFEQASSEASISISSISVNTPSLNIPESMTSASEMLSTPATIDQVCPRSGRSPGAALSILSFKNGGLRPVPPDDNQSSTSSSISLLPDPSPISSSDHKTPRSSLLPHENISVNTIAEENSKSTYSLVSLGDALGGPTGSQHLDEDQFQVGPVSNTEQHLMASKIEALELELLAARSEADELMLQLEAERQRSEFVSQYLQSVLTTDKASSPILAPSPPLPVEEPLITRIDTEAQTLDNHETVVELNKQEYESFMLIAMKLQDENKGLWEQLSAKDETVTLMTEAIDTLTGDVKHLTDQLSIVGDTNLSLQVALQEKTSIIEKYEIERAQIAQSDSCQQTDNIEHVSKGTSADDLIAPLTSADAEQQTSLPDFDHSKSDEKHDAPEVPDAPLKALAEVEEQISAKQEELAAIVAKIDALGSWYSKEVERLDAIQYVQGEADNLAAISKQEGKQSSLLEIAGSVLPAPSHDGARELRTITKLIEALNFQSYREPSTSNDVSTSVLAYASDVLPRVIDIQRMLRALQKEYYAYLEQLKVNTKTIAALSADNEALRTANVSLKESIETFKNQADSTELTKEDLIEQRSSPLQPSSTSVKAPITSLLDQLIPFINDELTKKKALNVDALEKTIVAKTQLQFPSDLKPDLSSVMNDFSISADISIAEDTLSQLQDLTEAGDQTIHECTTSKWEDYKTLLAIAQAKHHAKQPVTSDIGIVSDQPDYKLHYLRSKLDAFILRHQILKIFSVFRALLKEPGQQFGAEETLCPDDLSKLIDDFKAVSTLKEHILEENKKLIEVLEYKNRRVHELETILLALCQQSLHFFRAYKSVLDMATVSLVKQDSLLMHSDMGAINMILLHAKVCLENSVSNTIKEAIIRAFNEQPHMQVTSSSYVSTINPVTCVSASTESTQALSLPTTGQEPGVTARPLIQADIQHPFLLSHCDPASSQGQLPESTAKHTPLMQAVIEGNYNNITSALINKYAGKQDAAGMTALMHAVVHRRFGLISKLAAAEAGMALPDGRTALFLAIELKYMDVAEELRPYEGIPVARIPAAHGEQKHGHTRKGPQTKRDSFGPANMETGYKGKLTGLTNLMAAAEKNDLVTVWILIPNEGCIQDSKGRTALMYAAYAGNLRVAELLLQFEARMQDTNGCTALMYAVQAGNIEVVKLLASTESRIINNTFSTALMMAARLKSEQMMNILAPLECGIQGYSSSTTRLLPISPRSRRGSINPQNFFTADANGSGVTALMISANVGFKYGVTLLLNEELSLRDRNGYSAYDYAVYGKGDEHMQKEIAYLLRE